VEPGRPEQLVDTSSRRRRRWGDRRDLPRARPGGQRLYVADFHNARVLVYDSRWRPVVRRGAFVDPAVPVWYAPHGIQAIGNRIFVTYAGGRR
jgi:hypothetical protein